MPTLLAPYGIPLLQLHFTIAVAAQVLRQRSDLFGDGCLERCRGAEDVAVGAAGAGAAGGLVGFSGHGFWGVEEKRERG